MKAILISIKPKWVAKILNGEKTIEIRKTCPKRDLPIDVYIYCTKDKKYANLINRGGFLTGMVVAKFTLNKVEEIRFDDKDIQRQACLTENELFDYLFDDTPYQEDMRKGYAWHISNLVIFDKPKELNEFKHYNKPNCDGCPFQYSAWCDYHIEVECDDIPLTKAPQSFCYIEVE